MRVNKCKWTWIGTEPIGENDCVNLLGRQLIFLPSVAINIYKFTAPRAYTQIFKWLKLPKLILFLFNRRRITAKMVPKHQSIKAVKIELSMISLITCCLWISLGQPVFFCLLSWSYFPQTYWINWKPFVLLLFSLHILNWFLKQL